MPGTLYLVATPIGNLGDFSPRAVETLQNADFIAAEDTRVSVKLLNHFDIKKPLVSYHEHNRASAGQAILTRLPVSGLPTGRFTFEGFLPSGKKERREQLHELTGETRTMIFHEAPHRLRATLADMAEAFGGDRKIALCRELTKLHEDTVRTTLAAAADYYAANEPRGEYVLVIAGREKSAAAALTLEEGVALVLRRREEGMRLKDAVRAVADDTGLSRNALYDAALKNLA